MTDYFLGIDLGTSGVKAGMLNPMSMELNCVSMREYDDVPEQDPDILWERTIESIKESVRMLDDHGQVRAIGLSGQMHGAALYDPDGMLIGPIINWKDEKRSTKAIIEKMKRIMGDRTWDELGTNISSGYTGAILFGIKENDPDLFRQISHFVLPTDFLRGKLLGKNSYATDQTNAFGTGLFNTKLNCWQEELIERFQLPLNIFPEIHGSSQQAGAIAEEVADLVGLQRGIPIIYGGGDNQMSMLGSGLVGAGSPLLVNIGTAAQISRVISKYQKYPGLDTRSYFQGSYAIVAASLAGGGSYKWLRDEARRAGVDIDYCEMDELASQIPPGAGGLVFCSGPTRQNPERKRGFYGNTALESSPAHRARAVMEGVLMDLYTPFQILREDDHCNFMVGAGKGLQKSRVWSRVTADLFAKSVRITNSESAVCGAALMAALGAGYIDNLDEPVQSIACQVEIIPELANARFYRDEFIPTWYTWVSEA